MHHAACRDRGLTTAVETFVRVGPALQCCHALSATSRADEAALPAPFEQECCATRLVGKRFLESVSDRARAIDCPAMAPSGGSSAAGYHI